MVNLKMHVPMKHNFSPQPLVGRPGTPSYTVNHAVLNTKPNDLRKTHRDSETKRNDPLKLAVQRFPQTKPRALVPVDLTKRTLPVGYNHLSHTPSGMIAMNRPKIKSIPLKTMTFAY